MRKKIMWAVLLVVACFSIVFAFADSYTYEDAALKIEINSGEYEQIITKENVENFSDYLLSIGSSVDEYKNQFENEGLVIRAFDNKNNRVLTLTAVKDSEAERYFDINEQTKETRASYRRLHGSGEYKTMEGISYNAVEWKSFPNNMGRWLMLRYDYKPSEKVEARGFQRRTVRNGYTITLDLKVNSTKALTSGDNSALNRVFNAMRFEKILSLPPLPVLFNEAKTAPSETTSPSFVMSGKTAPGATIRAAIVSFSTNTSQVIEEVAKKNGDYKFEVTLPSEDLYIMTLTVEKEGSITLEKQYTITYKKAELKISVDTYPPETLNRDSYTVSGTAESGTQVTLSVNGKTESKKTNNKGTYSFNINTSNEGQYEITLSFSKTGFETKTFKYSASRTISADEKLSKLVSSALDINYTTLTRNIDKYDGKVLVYEGYVLAINEKTSDWETVFSLDSLETSDKRLVIASSPARPSVEVGNHVLFYGELMGTTLYEGEGEAARERPKIFLNHIQTIAQ